MASSLSRPQCVRMYQEIRLRTVPLACVYSRHIYIYIYIPTFDWKYTYSITMTSLERHSISNHRQIQSVVKSLFKLSSKKTSKVRIIGLCEGNPPVTGGKWFQAMTSSCRLCLCAFDVPFSETSPRLPESRYLSLFTPKTLPLASVSVSTSTRTHIVNIFASANSRTISLSNTITLSTQLNTSHFELCFIY